MAFLVLLFFLSANSCHGNARDSIVAIPGKSEGGMLAMDGVAPFREAAASLDIDTIPGNEPLSVVRVINGREVKVELDGSFYTKLEFKGMDVDAHNPYLKSSKGVRIVRNYSNAEEEVYLPPDERAGAGNVTEWRVHTQVENQGSLLKITYLKREMADGMWIVGLSTTMVVLDSLGHEIFRHEYKGHAGSLQMTPDGKYALFAVLPIETVRNAGAKDQDEGFEIWDVRHDVLLYRELNNDPKMWFGGVEAGENYLRVEYTFPGDDKYDSYQVLFDPAELRIYSKKFSHVEWKKVGELWSKVHGNFLLLVKYFEFVQKEIGDE